jgi:hypothetical protein
MKKRKTKKTEMPLKIRMKKEEPRMKITVRK